MCCFKIFDDYADRWFTFSEGMSSEKRRDNYMCDVTYVTNSELGFDYLRDNLASVSPVSLKVNFLVLKAISSFRALSFLTKFDLFESKFLFFESHV